MAVGCPETLRRLMPCRMNVREALNLRPEQQESPLALGKAAADEAGGKSALSLPGDRLEPAPA